MERDLYIKLPEQIPHLRRVARNYKEKPIFPEYKRSLAPAYCFDSEFKVLTDRFKTHPLDRNFINWVYWEDYIIRYLPKDYPQKYGFVRHDLRVIGLKVDLSWEESNLTLAHELAHIATSPMYAGLWGPMYEAFEDAMDTIAEPLANNYGLINYARYLLTRPGHSFRMLEEKRNTSEIPDQLMFNL